MKQLIKINTLDEYRVFFDTKSENYEFLLLKISSRCTVSFVVQKIFEQWFGGVEQSAKLKCGLVEVISAREVSNRIASDFSIKHESPQAIWLSKDRKVKWSDSHHRITVDNLQRCLSLLGDKP
ncbi:MAG: bacillithiol system redox-active protein YtxJ [Ignavibacteria bacterium]|nr:bacillithiol system redox-active protein YtxJ [Ignavibacteria bacterium]